MSDNLKYYESIPGHLFDIEAEALQKLASGKNCVDIGTHHGRSCLAMSATAAKVITIDNYKGDEQINAPNKMQAANNIRNSPFSDRIVIMDGDWRECLVRLDLDMVDFVFYDARHTPPNAEGLFLDLMLSWGISSFAVHDYKPSQPDFWHVVESVERFPRPYAMLIGSLAAWY